MRHLGGRSPDTARLPMENLERKTAHWFPNESRTNEGKRLVYSNSVKDMVNVLDFVQLGGPSGTVLQTFDWVVALLRWTPEFGQVCK